MDSVTLAPPRSASLLTTRMAWIAAAGVLLLYAGAWPLISPELYIYNFRWIEHIREHGPVGAFAVPFSNYNPPYLYLLAVLSPLPFSVEAINKLAAYIGLAWLAYAVWRIGKSAGTRDPEQAALLSLLLPSLLLNAGVLGQTDAFWVAPCLLAVAAALDRRWVALSAWAGLAVAFKAQAVFLAPFVAGVLLRQRAWPAFLAAPLVYALALAPAWLAGWPLMDLLTIYIGQAQHPSYFSTAPNPWVLLFYKQEVVPMAVTYLAFALAAAGAVGIVVALQKVRGRLIELALLSAILIPWLLPRMHERYFMLADFLAFAMACRSRTRRAWIIFALVEAGSFLAVLGYCLGSFFVNSLGAIPMTAGLALLLWSLLRPGEDERREPLP